MVAINAKSVSALKISDGDAIILVLPEGTPNYVLEESDRRMREWIDAVYPSSPSVTLRSGQCLAVIPKDGVAEIYRLEGVADQYESVATLSVTRTA